MVGVPTWGITVSAADRADRHASGAHNRLSREVCDEFSASPHPMAASWHR